MPESRKGVIGGIIPAAQPPEQAPEPAMTPTQRATSKRLTVQAESLEEMDTWLWAAEQNGLSLHALARAAIRAYVERTRTGDRVPAEFRGQGPRLRGKRKDKGGA